MAKAGTTARGSSAAGTGHCVHGCHKPLTQGCSRCTKVHWAPRADGKATQEVPRGLEWSHACPLPQAASLLLSHSFWSQYLNEGPELPSTRLHLGTCKLLPSHITAPSPSALQPCGECRLQQGVPQATTRWEKILWHCCPGRKGTSLRRSFVLTLDGGKMV